MIWCEHCRDHFEADHYDDDGHLVGLEFGPVGAGMFRERIYELALREIAYYDGELPAAWARELARKAIREGTLSGEARRG